MRARDRSQPTIALVHGGERGVDRFLRRGGHVPDQEDQHSHRTVEAWYPLASSPQATALLARYGVAIQ